MCSKDPAGRTGLWPGLASLPDRMELAKRLSPLTYVRAGLPPVLTIHGDLDTDVPYQQGVRLHEALDRAGVPNEFVTITGGKHGFWTREQNLRAQQPSSTFWKNTESSPANAAPGSAADRATCTASGGDAVISLSSASKSIQPNRV